MKSWLSTKTKHKSLKNMNFKRKMEEKAVEGNCERGQRHSERTEGVGISRLEVVLIRKKLETESNATKWANKGF